MISLLNKKKNVLRTILFKELKFLHKESTLGSYRILKLYEIYA